MKATADIKNRTPCIKSTKDKPKEQTSTKRRKHMIKRRK